MDVILLERIRNLGNLGETVKVKPGFGRNYLIPNRKAVPATPENVEKFEAQRAELERQQAASLGEAQTRAAAMEGLSVTIGARAGTEGKLYGSIGTAEIADAITAAGHEVAKREVRLENGALRSTGEYNIGLQLHPDVLFDVTVIVVAEAAEG
ncbi:MAG: 50S ribosomal protein L9 [Gammaproteobacteria bacterium]|nr:50S ribosomal protein L9 [Gammaproteobacteria bacterium]